MTEEQALKELLNLSVKEGWHNDTIHELIMTIAGRRKKPKINTNEDEIYS
tara:strand:+ start:212 stop:361 length:150 start_codon:yes stop_codon:yes gene_type:complete